MGVGRFVGLKARRGRLWGCFSALGMSEAGQPALTSSHHAWYILTRMTRVHRDEKKTVHIEYSS